MPERRVARANTHALPLLLDIIESTLYLYEKVPHPRQLEEIISSASATGLSLGSVEYYVGFEEHLPFGFVGLNPQEDSGELLGPYLYREYLGKGYGKFLLEYGVDLARAREVRLLYLLLPRTAELAVNFFCRNGFEIVSADTEFIKRWHDCLLAEREIAEDTILLAQLIDADE